MRTLFVLALGSLAVLAASCGTNPCGTNPAIPVTCVSACGATPVSKCSSCGSGLFLAERCLPDGGMTDGGP